jgi:glycine/D-amino acid oxidase-like deaminating enzyme
MTKQTTSLWMDSTQIPQFPALKGEISTDVAIIGGGITGLTAALLLKRSGKKVALIDHSKITTGNSIQTTAHLTKILDQKYYQLISDFGLENATLAAKSSREAINQIESLVNELKISCDFVRDAM